MPEFFKGWRRKAGCVTLVLALAMMAGWILSEHAEETIAIHLGDGDFHLLLSARGSLGWRKYFDEDHVGSPAWLVPHWDSRILRNKQSEVFWSYWTGWYGIGVRGGPWRTMWVIPYWLVTLPLTLLSACLILWRPRKRG